MTKYKLRDVLRDYGLALLFFVIAMLLLPRHPVSALLTGGASVVLCVSILLQVLGKL